MSATRKLCPVCRMAAVRVTHSRETSIGRRRRHVCAGCGHRWSSLEVEEGKLTERERAAKDALEKLIDALQRAVTDIKALSDERR